MTLEEIREALGRSARLRMTRFDERMSAQDRVDALEDHLNATAVARAELEEARMYAAGVAHKLGDEWDRIQGWETHLRRSQPTQEDVRRAKREIRPDLHDAIREARFLVARLSEQIHRLEQDDTVASRLYTIITGG